ncbi:hypothetical protein [uncultured Flavobacterium sp.]|uniref:hypothetical protein n=1 Tax=uncultured Flavobacterium sp. TaxID=165435 RepID=UPI0025D959BB|nr:hypothetical protein [uncultured Flavobacterium sp.]
MKKYLLFIAIAAGFTSHAQVPDRFSAISINDSLVYERPDFSFYSKNYNKVFDYYQYTFDAQKISQRSVYVSSDNKFFFGQNSGFVMDMSQPSYNAARINCGYAYDLGGLYHGLKNIFEMEKDYSVKRRDDRPQVLAGGKEQIRNWN